MEDEPIHSVEYGNHHWRLPNGTLHRVDGPAIEWFNGTKQWYLRDILFKNEEEWRKGLEALPIIDVNNA